MKTPEEIKKGLVHCKHCAPCLDCAYGDLRDTKYTCETALLSDALAYIQQLESLAPPVVIGTQIFSVCYSEDNDDFYVKSGVVAEIWYNCNGWFFLEERHTGPAFKTRDIGKLIYLDREEAELVCEEFRAKMPLSEPPKEG